MRFPFLFLAFIAIPLAEIAAFVVIGGRIGVFPTLGMVFLTAIAGSVLLRLQGFGILSRIRQETDAGRVPRRELVHGAMVLFAGLLLLLPGFVTDALGLLLFVPVFRDAVWSFLASRIHFVVDLGKGPLAGSRRQDDDDVIDLDASEYSQDRDPSSPWKRNDDKP